MGDIIKLPIITKHNIKADEMLCEIANSKPNHAFVIAWPEDGSVPTYHSSTGDVAVVLMRVQEFIHKYFNGDFSG